MRRPGVAAVWRLRLSRRLAATMCGAGLALAVACGLVQGCEAGPGTSESAGTSDTTGSLGPGVEPLTDPPAWVALAAGDDPFADHRPAEVLCPEQSWGGEGLSFEVDTGLCGYLSAVQPLRVDLDTQDTVDVVVGHFTLVAVEPAEAHAAILVDGLPVWEEHVPIPSPTHVYEATWTPPRPIPAGADVVFHLHNHGSNSWFLATLTRRSRL